MTNLPCTAVSRSVTESQQVRRRARTVDLEYAVAAGRVRISDRMACDCLPLMADVRLQRTNRERALAELLLVGKSPCHFPQVTAVSGVIALIADSPPLIVTRTVNRYGEKGSVFGLVATILPVLVSYSV